MMSDICEVKSQISECNLQSNVVHHSPYHMKWIWYSLHQALGLFFFFCKFYMLSVKFNYAAPFSLLKLFQSWFHPNFFVSFLCLRLFNISSICSWDVFDPVKCKADFFATAFHCCLLISHSLFCDVSHLRSFYPHYRHEQSHCVHLKVLQVNSGFLLPLSLLKYFISRANWSLTDVIFPS